MCPEFTVLNVYFLSLRILNNLRLPWKQSCPEHFHCIEYSFHIQDFWATCACPEKQSVPWIHCIEYIFFIIQNFEQHALALKNRICPENFHCIEIFFIFQHFWATSACLQKQSLHWIFQPGGPAAPPAPPPRTPLLMDQSQKNLRQSKNQDFYAAKSSKIMNWRFLITAWIWR